VLLAARGAGTDHTSAATNLAALVQVVAEQPGRRILNAADPDAPDGLAISRAVAALAGHEWQEVLLDEAAPRDLGEHPWHTLPPIVGAWCPAASRSPPNACRRLGCWRA